ncbi:hypothetical protein [Inediibacterium massiliense]|uniref:hypothetical protein n=1 Tax=Inediibacterium massiliense TaxID=1658111 RepID=UPI0006B481B9|nr:hypothetical protein [Inediibacterium massiliense]
MKIHEDVVKKLFKEKLDSSLFHIQMNPHMKQNILNSLHPIKKQNILQRILNYEIRIHLSPAIGCILIFMILIGSFTAHQIKLTHKEIVHAQIYPVLLQNRR